MHLMMYNSRFLQINCLLIISVFTSSRLSGNICTVLSNPHSTVHSGSLKIFIICHLTYLFANQVNNLENLYNSTSRPHIIKLRLAQYLLYSVRFLNKTVKLQSSLVY